MGHAHDVIDDLRSPTRSLRQASPDVWAGFGQLHQAVFAKTFVVAIEELVEDLSVDDVEGSKHRQTRHRRRRSPHDAANAPLVERVVGIRMHDVGSNQRSIDVIEGGLAFGGSSFLVMHGRVTLYQPGRFLGSVEVEPQGVFETSKANRQKTP